MHYRVSHTRSTFVSIAGKLAIWARLTLCLTICK